MKVSRCISIYFFLVAGACTVALGQNTGTLRGTVELKSQGTPLHNATVTILQLDRRAQTGDDGGYEFTGVPAGKYDVIAHVHALVDDKRSVQVPAGGAAEANFQLGFAPYREQLTVTASGREELATEAFQAVTAIDALELSTRMAASLGEVLEQEAGVTKRSFGPGTSRPVVRGFDGDRVLVLQDGIRTGTLSSQSGDHGEPVDTASLERLEIVRGPATLLYGSNAIGGVVNTISSHHQVHSHPHSGLRGYMTGNAGSTNALAAGSGGFEFGAGDWLFWGKGGSQRTGDYHTPIGEIENSHTRASQTQAGFGRYGERGFFSLGYTLQDGRYGIPSVVEELTAGAHDDHEDEEEEHEDEHEHGEIDITYRRHSLRFDTGIHGGLGPAFDQFTVSVNYSDWQHRELEGDQIGTRFYNRQLVGRGVLDQHKYGRLSGSLGFWGMHRAFKAIGAEALAPPVDQNAVAFFGLEQIQFERFRIQLGGRVEHNRYSPDELAKRSFTGFSGAAGIHVPLWQGGAAVANYTRSFRAPALEELYNLGPHLGNLTFEIGNPLLRREQSDGIDFSLRHQSGRFRGEFNVFRYGINDFIYLAPTGEVEDGLIEANYAQADARYVGAEARAEMRMHTRLWLLLGFDAVDAQLRQTDVPLPRIPPVRGRIGLDVRSGNFSVRPELVLANRQDQLFPTETRTPGYGLLNLNASYTRATQHTIHVFAVNLFNATDKLYRNHLSFIKDVAPEIGRGVRFTYTLRFF